MLGGRDLMVLLPGLVAGLVVRHVSKQQLAFPLSIFTVGFLFLKVPLWGLNSVVRRGVPFPFHCDN